MSEDDEKQTEGEGQETQSAIEEKATRWGWRPDGELSAEEFVARGMEDGPMLRAQVKKLDRQLAQATDQIKMLVEGMAQNRKQGYEQALREIKSRQVAAVEDGDVDAYRKLDEEAEAVRKRAEKETQYQQPQQDQPRPEFEEWQERNSWFNEDQELRAYAEAMGDYVARTKPHLTYQQLLNEVTRLTKEAHPKRFGNTRRSQPSAVDNGTSTGTSKSKGKGYDDIPKEDRDQIDRLCKKFPALKREDLAKKYISKYME